ncbi:helix-turn-helix domain-containing protein [Paracoccus kondratievae]
MEEVFDLFGNPVDPGTGKPGRPRRVATLEERNKVKALLAVGWSNERIASVLQMSLPTFRRNFFMS